ncbi:MAG: hypothetical protein V1875_03750 [Candidatus Altiarchaeota archaeon]
MRLCAVLCVLAMLSINVSSFTLIDPSCSSITNPTSQKSCDAGACASGPCIYHISLAYKGGYCSCDTTTTTTTTLQACTYDRKYEQCVGTCRKGYDCIPSGQYQCSCQATTTTTLRTQIPCYFSEKQGKCTGACSLGTCTETAPYQCACMKSAAFPKSTSTTTTTIYMPTVSDLIPHITDTTILRPVVDIKPAAELLWAIRDDDGDGVFNGQDDCPQTPAGIPVFDDGCGCTDSDGGKKSHLFGSITQTSAQTTTTQGTLSPAVAPQVSALVVDDYCINNMTLIEYYCNESQRRDSYNYTCPAGCRSGVCVCNDGDGGKVYNVTGTFMVHVGGGGGQRAGQSPGKGQVTLAGGQTVRLQNTQYAAQAAQYRVPAYMPMGDYCLSDTVLKEFYCDENGTINTETVFCKDACQGGRCVIIPNVRILLVPVNWNGNQASFNTAVNTQMNFFKNAVPLKDCPEELEIVKMNVTDGMSAADFLGCTTASVGYHVDDLGIDRADYDVVVGLTNQKTCGNIVGRSNGADTVWVYSGYDSVGAHELGHIFGLEDQYCSNPAGATDGRCNDGDLQGDGATTGDVNWLDAAGPYDCPAGGGVDSGGDPCCNFYDDVYNDKYVNCTGVSYGICCLGNRHTAGGGRSIMSFADVDLFSPGARAFDGHDKAHLATVPQLQCGNSLLMYLPLLHLIGSDAQAMSDDAAASETPGTEQPEGYSTNLSSGKVVAVSLEVGKDGKVKENRLLLLDGRPTMIPAEDGAYNLMVVDSEGNELWSALFNLYFDYEGPVTFGQDYSGAGVVSREVSYRIPYYPQMKEVRLYKQGKIIYTRGLDFCNADGVCGPTETEQTCPSDCRSGEKDKVCDKAADGICDPDCGTNVDPDCSKAKVQTAKPAEPTENEGCMPLLLAPLALLAAGAHKLLFA